MTIRIGCAALALGVVLAAPQAAEAKGASQAKVEGPGLGKAIVLKSDDGGDPSSGSRLGRLAELGGFFPAVFVRSPDPMLDTAPKGALGPRYTVTYVMPGPNGKDSIIRQDLYPYARPAPVSFTPPGQPFWGHEKTRGGWFVSQPGLRALLVSAGLPRTAPGGSDSSGLDLTGRTGTLLVIAAALAVALAATALAVRRRPRPALH